MLNNKKLRHCWAQIVSWAPIHARKTFIVLAPGYIPLPYIPFVLTSLWRVSINPSRSLHLGLSPRSVFPSSCCILLLTCPCDCTLLSSNPHELCVRRNDTRCFPCLKLYLLFSLRLTPNTHRSTSYQTHTGGSPLSSSSSKPRLLVNHAWSDCSLINLVLGVSWAPSYRCGDLSSFIHYKALSVSAVRSLLGDRLISAVCTAILVW